MINIRTTSTDGKVVGFMANDGYVRPNGCAVNQDGLSKDYPYCVMFTKVVRYKDGGLYGKQMKHHFSSFDGAKEQYKEYMALKPSGDIIAYCDVFVVVNKI